ncbi:MFI2 [Cordylochernes scorpioides]|uniref:MFI2 n=1 Tax=Cordylochernes scorpioides TaxID=51811 RepID=A0ABY6KV48_9ARAC|nr:MFI2 [Cordylochernes scorpioides]
MHEGTCGPLGMRRTWRFLLGAALPEYRSSIYASFLPVGNLYKTAQSQSHRDGGCAEKEHSSLCKLCSSKDCSAEDEFAGYQGAIKCLADDKGDIAFTTIEATFQYFRGSSRAAEYKLVCKNGTLVDVAENTACYWARRPTAAFLASSTVAKDRKNLFYNNVRDLYNLFTLPYPDWLIRLLPALKDNVTNIIQTNDSNNQWKSYLVIVIYGDHALAERTCQKWFSQFKSGNFDLENEEKQERATKLDVDPTQTQMEFAKTLGVTQPAIFHRLKK